MQILLHNDVASAGERRVLFANEGSFDRGVVGGVFRAVDKAEQIALIKVAKAINLIDGGDCVTKLRHDLGRQLEGNVGALGANVEEDIARRGHRLARAGADFLERMELGGTRRGEEPIPYLGAEAEDAG